ncbi:lysosomal alpha-mannosidase-like isoform X2 [Sitodiplosis mosellana]|uniref:lysosomal alpha-mannosidase-like isoform X2 n=1 Tax=Sitodiplosis mosellana TaxID=263140 RepID=UPI002443A407|nr:lysosomal alpha-mannosidase-like isoform X2 [Sitodiplosis mosellana]XP_055295902.1 lysosomal alpha-mannosidase-like isoform X2 [Sitodiplosis mosellana]
MWLVSHRLCACILLFILVCSELTEAAAKHQRRSKKRERKCGYDGCPQPKPDMLNVHIVAHTHDDVGWLKTVDQYYYGAKPTIQKANVENILDSVVSALLKDPEKRFIYVESAFFFKWWSHQAAAFKEQVKQLVNEGRLEFIGGAWSMNDEAATHYHSTVDQFTWGLRKLNDTFGECGRPKIGWQIDPFGHSRELASLLAQMGYDGLFLGRIDYQDKVNRFTNREAEMVWHASDSLGEKADLFTGVLYNTYSPPPGFCFDILCADEPIIDDKSSPEYNVDRKVADLLEYFKNALGAYRTNNVLITMGDDFNYQHAPAWFNNLDKIILNINQRQLSGLKVNAFYSTPSCYLKSLYDSGIKFPTKSDDFFPYASDPHSFWTGYFTSRPTLKRFERIGNHYLQVCKQLSVLAKKKTASFEENLSNLREAMGVMQHHDAVTGTEKQHVAEDYARLLQIGIEKCSENIKESLNQLTVDDDNSEITRDEGFDSRLRFEYESCADLNISSCDVSEKSDKFVVSLYNPLAHSTFQYVRVPVTDGDYEVLDYRNVPVASQVVAIPTEVQSLSFRKSNAESELVILANELPPLGYKSYYVQKKPKIAKSIEPVVTLVTHRDEFMADDSFAGRETGPFTIGNQYLNLSFNENGLLESAATEEVQMKVQQNFYIYQGFLGNNEVWENRSSGAYIFRPNGTEVYDVAKHADVRVIRGDLVDEVHQTFNEWISQVVRIYKNENYAEFQWLVGPIPVADKIGREIITRFDTDIQSNGIFHTDSNGREMLKRVRDQRPTWNLTLWEKIAGNYYPITSKIAIEDNTRRFAILNDRAQGGSSLADGSIELMVHRRLLHDDAFGVGEALNETAYGDGLIARGTSYFVFGPKKHTEKTSTEANERFVQQQILLPSWLFFSNVSHLSYDVWRNSYKNIFSGLSLSLPKNIHLLTFEPWKSDSILIRFEHILEKDEDKQYSQAVTFNFQDVFRSFDVISIREATLAANQWLDEAKRLHFKSDNLNETPSTTETATVRMSEHERRHPQIDIKPDVSPRQYSKRAYKLIRQNAVEGDNNDLTITLKPMEIRTFIVELEPKP